MEAVLDGLLFTFANVYAVMSAVPFISFVVLWFVFFWINRNKKQATQRTMDITAVLLIGSVSSMYDHIFHSKFGFFCILFLMLLFFGFVGNMQYRAKGIINYARLLQVTLRIGFLGLSVIYVILLFVGTIKYYLVI